MVAPTQAIVTTTEAPRHGAILPRLGSASDATDSGLVTGARDITKLPKSGRSVGPAMDSPRRPWCAYVSVIRERRKYVATELIRGHDKFPDMPTRACMDH